jgi:uncharacterized protein (DUF488 family)
LAKSLKIAGIDYEHIAGLGGFRPTSKESPNKGWRNTSFRGYADYMLTPDFSQNLDKVIATAKHESVALMCAEAVPWRCHRSLVADALTVRDIPVAEIVSNSRTEPHKLTAFAVADGDKITYPPEKVVQPQMDLPLD